MKILSMALVVCLLLAGCAVDETSAVKPQEWKEEPFTRVKAWDRAGETGVRADVWLECEEGDKVSAAYRNELERRLGNPRSVYVLCKDGTKRALPLEVHTPDGVTLRIRTYHLVLKGKEVNFLQP